VATCLTDGGGLDLVMQSEDGAGRSRGAGERGFLCSRHTGGGESGGAEFQGRGGTARLKGGRAGRLAPTYHPWNRGVAVFPSRFFSPLGSYS